MWSRLHNLLLSTLFIYGATQQLFTSMNRLKPVISTEEQLVKEVEKYVQNEGNRLKKIKSILADIKKERGDSVDIGNPVQSYLLVRRLQRTWEKVEEEIVSRINEEAYKSNADILREGDYPTQEDYEGSKEAILRLQQTYKLATSDIANGHVGGECRSPPLQARDCYEIGLTAWEDDAKLVCEWMEEAEERLGHETIIDVPLFVDIMSHRAECLHQTQTANHNGTVIANYIITIREIDPGNLYALQKRSFFLNQGKHVGNTADRTVFKIDDNYKMLCRGEKVTALTVNETKPDLVECKTLPNEVNESSNLLCRLTHYNKPSLFIRPAKEEVLVDQPRLVVFHDILTDKEMDLLINMSKAKLKPSTVYNSTRETGSTSRMRVSSVAWHSLMDTPELHGVLPRIEDYTGLSTDPKDTSLYQVANYGLGGHYLYHKDDTKEGFKYNDGIPSKRLATVLFYLSDVEAGGATVFPLLGVRISPTKGSAAFWFNFLRNGTLDDDTLHAGCPVLLGEKWAANLWIYDYGQVFRHKCGLTPDVLY